MTPQSTFLIAAPIRAGREAGLRALLGTMNRLPGFAEPRNAVVPFGEFETIHFARFVILQDPTSGDLAVYGTSFPDAPLYLAFIADCDGDAAVLLADLADRAGSGLRAIFSHCGVSETTDLLSWMHAHSVRAAAHYVHGIGRTVRQTREEAALHEALARRLRAMPAAGHAREVHRALAQSVRDQGPRLSPEATTPWSWRVQQLARAAAAIAVALVIFAPLFLLPLPRALLVYVVALLLAAVAIAVFVIILRRHETSDPEILTPPASDHLANLGAIQDLDITNQYTAFGALKPGAFRRWTMSAVLAAIDVATPILYPRGNLARIRTIHSASWVFFDDKRRVLFVSNYDGSAESYMDDFVNKVAFGLNLAFSHGLGYPRTRFMLWGGAEREQEFKNAQRRHALPTEVWYKAYPGLSLFDIERNTRIRQGLERSNMTDVEVRRWLAEI